MGSLNVPLPVSDYAPNGHLSMQISSPTEIPNGTERGGSKNVRWGMRPRRTFAYDGDGSTPCKDTSACQGTGDVVRIYRNASVAGMTSPQPTMDASVQVEMNRDNRERNRVWWPTPDSTQLNDRMPAIFAVQQHDRMMMQDEMAAAIMAGSNPIPRGGA